MDRIYYVFWDYDDESDKELDIDGEAYAELIDTCFQYAEAFAVTYSLGGFHAGQRRQDSVFQHCIGKKAIQNGRVRCYFKCCQATRKYLSESYHCLFGWFWNGKDRGNLPEDLAFYRGDGSAVFASETHEGQCYLYPRKEEDFSSVLNAAGWSLGTAGGGCLPSYLKMSWLNPQPNHLPEST